MGTPIPHGGAVRENPAPDRSAIPLPRIDTSGRENHRTAAGPNKRDAGCPSRGAEKTDLQGRCLQRHDHLLKLIQQIAVIDPEMSGMLRDLVARFNYETLLQLLK